VQRDRKKKGTQGVPGVKVCDGGEWARGNEKERKKSARVTDRTLVKRRRDHVSKQMPKLMGQCFSEGDKEGGGTKEVGLKYRKKE